MRAAGVPSIYPLHTLTDCTSSCAMNTNAQFSLIHNHSSRAAFPWNQPTSRDIGLNPCVDSMEGTGHAFAFTTCSKKHLPNCLPHSTYRLLFSCSPISMTVLGKVKPNIVN